MPDISISLFGSFALRVQGERQVLSLSGPTRKVLVLLASHHNKALRKESIIELAWPNTHFDKARSSLNTAIWRIKKFIRGHAGLEIKTQEDLVKLSINASVGLDTRDLEYAVEEIIGDEPGKTQCTNGMLETLQSTQSRCAGIFLEGHTDHWVLPYREHYSTYYAQLLSYLLRDAAEKTHYEIALKHGREILKRDPLREGTQREVMWLYVLNGQRAQALRQYRDLKACLKSELDIDPMLETQSLYRHILESETFDILSENTTPITAEYAELTTLEETRRSFFRHLTTH